MNIKRAYDKQEFNKMYDAIVNGRISKHEWIEYCMKISPAMKDEIYHELDETYRNIKRKNR